MIHKPNIETEYKFEVSDLKSLVDVLDGQYKRVRDREYQSNVMFDNPQGLMAITDGRVRVRTCGEFGNKELTYKKPLPPTSGAKREIEYEIGFVDNTDQIEKILKAMEFTPSTSYERYRTEWADDNVSITLDEYPHAVYLEIEGKQEHIDKVAKKLGFDISQALTKPADTLFQEWRESRGLPRKDNMRFDDYDI